MLVFRESIQNCINIFYNIYDYINDYFFSHCNDILEEDFNFLFDISNVYDSEDEEWITTSEY